MCCHAILFKDCWYAHILDNMQACPFQNRVGWECPLNDLILLNMGESRLLIRTLIFSFHFKVNIQSIFLFPKKESILNVFLENVSPPSSLYLLLDLFLVPSF